MPEHSEVCPGPMPPDRKHGWRPRRAHVVILVLGLAMAGGWWALHAIHPFLAPVKPITARYLVIEGWIPDYALEQAAAEFRRGGYQQAFTTGGPLVRGSFLSEYRNYANLAAATLLKLGLGTNEVVAVGAERRQRNRTFASAVALREFCRERGIALDSLNLVSVGPHARRSAVCFQRALGPDVQVGIIAIEDQDYDPEHWWVSSHGLKSVAGELVAFLYAWIALDYGE